MALTPTSVRAYLRALFIDQGMPVDRITLVHRDVLETACIPYRIGQSFNSLLDALTPGQADALADALRDDEVEEA